MPISGIPNDVVSSRTGSSSHAAVRKQATSPEGSETMVKIDETQEELDAIETMMVSTNVAEIARTHPEFATYTRTVRFKHALMEREYQLSQMRTAIPKLVAFVIAVALILSVHGTITREQLDFIAFARNAGIAIRVIYAVLSILVIAAILSKKLNFYRISVHAFLLFAGLTFPLVFVPGFNSFLACRAIESLNGLSLGELGINADSPRVTIINETQPGGTEVYRYDGIDYGEYAACYREESVLLSFWQKTDNEDIAYVDLLGIHVEFILTLSYLATLFLIILNTSVLNVAVIANLASMLLCLGMSVWAAAISGTTVGMRMPLVFILTCGGVLMGAIGLFVNEQRLRYYFILDKAREKGLKAVILARMESKKKEEKSRFIATVSHEIRTPIHGILGLTDLLLEENLDADVKDRLVVVNECGNTLLNIVNDLLDESKLASTGLTLANGPFNIIDMIEDAVKNLAVQCQSKGIELTIHLGSALRVYAAERNAMGDRQRIVQIITNLVSNAKKFTPKGGNIYIFANLMLSCREQEHKPRNGTMIEGRHETTGREVRSHPASSFDLQPSGNKETLNVAPSGESASSHDACSAEFTSFDRSYPEHDTYNMKLNDVHYSEPFTLKVTVKDEGIGIEPKDHKRIFKMFEQVNTSESQKVPGTGLGLGISQKLCEMMGGGISLRSALGKGSTFTASMVLDWEDTGPPPVQLRDGGRTEVHVHPTMSSSRGDSSSAESSGHVVAHPSDSDAKQYKSTGKHRPRRVLIVTGNQYIFSVLMSYLSSCGHDVITLSSIDSDLHNLRRLLVPSSPQDRGATAAGTKPPQMPVPFTTAVIDCDSFMLEQHRLGRLESAHLRSILQLLLDVHKSEDARLRRFYSESEGIRPVLLTRFTADLSSVTSKYSARIVRKPIRLRDITGVILRDPSKKALLEEDSTFMEREERVYAEIEKMAETRGFSPRHADLALEASMHMEPSKSRLADERMAKNEVPRILVADDDHVCRVLLKKMLKSIPLFQDCDIEAFNDGEDVLESLGITYGSIPLARQGMHDSGGSPQHREGGLIHHPAESIPVSPQREAIATAVDKRVLLVIVDGQMERVGGVETIHSMRAAGYDCPAVIASGSCMENEKAEFRKAGADAVIGKPFNRRVLLSTMEKLRMQDILREKRTQLHLSASMLPSRSFAIRGPIEEGIAEETERSANLQEKEEEVSERANKYGGEHSSPPNEGGKSERGEVSSETTAVSRKSSSNASRVPIFDKKETIVISSPLRRVYRANSGMEAEREGAGRSRPPLPGAVRPKNGFFDDEGSVAAVSRGRGSSVGLRSREQGLIKGTPRVFGTSSERSPGELDYEFKRLTTKGCWTEKGTHSDFDRAHEDLQVSDLLEPIETDVDNGAGGEAKNKEGRNFGKNRVDSAHLKDDFDAGDADTVLVVDDEKMCQMLVKRMMQSRGLKALVAKNGREALKVLEEKQPNLAFILMDCQMPVMNGYACTKEIRDRNWRYRDAVIIGGTAGGKEELCALSGMDGVLMKPFNAETVEAKVEAVRYARRRQSMKSF